MARALLLTTLALMTAFSGCIGDSETALDSPFEQEMDSTQEAAPTAPAPTPSGCRPHGNNNYGTMFSIGDDQIYAGGGESYWYRESNGVRGIQTEEMCPSNPDTKFFHVVTPQA